MIAQKREPPEIKIHQPPRKDKEPIRFTKKHHKFLMELWTGWLSGWTDEELAFMTSTHQSNAATRRKELEYLGLVKDTKTTRPTTTGRKAKVWSLTNQGIEKVMEINRKDQNDRT